MSNRECYKGCGATFDLRPYGPRGEWVCFTCAMATPEDEAATRKSFGAQLDAAGPIAIAGIEQGPVPYSEAMLRSLGSVQACPSCGSPEVEAHNPATVYACGSRDYDQRPGTFKQSALCAGKGAPDGH